MVCPGRAITLLALYAVFLHAEGNVFLEHEHANQMLGRVKRDNSVWDNVKLEEMWPGNLERECVEELCSYEEAREIFENDIGTNNFWKTYRGNPCFSNPCLNGGRCTSRNDAYECHCHHGVTGTHCENEVFENCDLNNGQCQQFCTKSEDTPRVQCSCATGYVLGDNQKSCNPTENIVCGKLYRQRQATTQRYIANSTESVDPHSNKYLSDMITEHEDSLESRKFHTGSFNWQTQRMYCEPGDCPWQAMLVNENKEPFCGGTILSQYFVLTAAHCINESMPFHILVGMVDTEDSSASTHEVDIILAHRKFDPETYDNDIALIKLKEAILFSQRVVPACLPEADFAEQVLMAQRSGYTSFMECDSETNQRTTRLQLRRVAFPRWRLPTSSDITGNMFWVMADAGCVGDCGGPHIVPYKDTYFVTGIASLQKRSRTGEMFGVFTQVSKFIDWIRASMCHFHG
ncbi:coagulation factor X-like [Ambystoma mexicanum]|uniref:coagulation factor X-like n=1 Tax=Ambystoma mexicanum TaxID=8296 RepID=UPI0037E856C5